MNAETNTEAMARSMEEARARAWEAATEMGEFGVAELARRAGTSLERAQLIVKAWVIDGAVVEVQMKIGAVRQVLRVVGTYAPPLRQVVRTPEDNMWHTIRRLRAVSPTDLSVHSTTDAIEVSIEAAAAYCRALLAAGFLRVSRKAQPRTGREAVYNLARDTGPRPPRPKRVRAVIDPNTDQTYLIGGAA